MNRTAKLTALLALCLLAVSCTPGPPAQTQPPVAAATFTPTPLPSATSTPMPTPTATPVPSGPCDNPLMSLDVGNWWNYQSTSSLSSSNYVLRVLEWDERVGLNARIEMTNMKTGIVDQDLVTCMEGGGIEDFPLFFVSAQLGEYVDGVLNTYYKSGIYSPSYQQFAEAGWLLNWEAEYWTEEPACFIKIVSDTTMCITRSSPITLTFETQGQYEPVTVPAGTFPQALKVTFTFRMATTLYFPGIGTSAPLTVRTTQWYAPFIGLVRSEVETAGVELMPGQESVAPIESVVELVEYNVAP